MIITSVQNIEIGKAKSIFFELFQSKIKRNPKELWKYVKVNKKDNIYIQSLVKDDVMTDASQNAERFNS